MLGILCKSPLHTDEVPKEVLFSADSLSHMLQNPMAELPMPHPSSVTVPLSALFLPTLPSILLSTHPQKSHW